MELNVIAFDPHAGRLVHIEPSVDARSWSAREQRFSKKLNAAKKYIFSEILFGLIRPWNLSKLLFLCCIQKVVMKLQAGK